MKLSSYLSQTLLLAIPIILAHFVEELVPFINTIIAGHIGETPLAAVALALSTFLAVMSLCWGVIVGVGVLAAKHFAMGREKRLSLIFMGALLLAMLLTIPVVLLFYNLHSVWLYFGQNEQVVAQAKPLMRVLSFSVFADLGKFILFQLLIACNRARVPMYVNTVGLVLLVFLGVGFAFGKYYFPELGLVGLGVADAITYWTLFIVLLIYCHYTTPLFRYCKRWKISHALKEAINLFKLGLPIGLMFAVEIGFFMIMALMIGRFSVEALAAHQIAMQWFFLILIILYGMGQATTIMVSKAQAKSERNKITGYTFAGFAIGIVPMFLVFMAYWQVPNLLVAIDTPKDQIIDPNMSAYAAEFLFFVGLILLVDCLRLILSASLRGLQKTQFPLWSAVLAFWGLGLPLCYGLSEWTSLGPKGVWLGVLIVIGVNALMQFVYWVHTVKKLSQQS